MAFQLGQLVEIQGLKGSVELPAQWRRAGQDLGAVNANGKKGQLVLWNEESKEWVVATFDALMVPVKEEFLRALGTADIEEFDVALGPRSDPEVMGEEITDLLAMSGAALCKLFIAPEDLEGMVAVGSKCLDAGDFVRLPSELEPGYLGKDCTAKTMNLDMESEDAEDFVKNSQVKMVEAAFSSVGQMLAPYTEAKFGFTVYSRSNTMLTLPLESGDESEYAPPEVENEEAASFLQLMYRAKLMVIVNAGPGNATLTLFPKAEGEGAKTFTVQPGMMAIVAVDQYKFSYVPSGNSLTFRSWFLDTPKVCDIKPNPSADLSVLPGAIAQEAKRPSGDPVTVCALATRYAMGCDNPSKCWMAFRHGGWDTFIEFPKLRWDLDIYYMQDAGPESGLSYTRHGGFSDGIELFDNKFFDISPAEAKGMDPTQRQVLEVSYIALSGAGYEKKKLMTKPLHCGMWVGLDKNEWSSIPKDIAGGFGASSSANAITSNRFSYVMNMKGASMTIDTACSASLVCTHTAKLYLLHKQWDPVEACITCGVNLLLSPLSFVGCCGAGMLSHNGRCFTYNQSADGYARGESTAAHCMKNRPYNLDNGDLVMCAGSQVNQDGRSASLTAPNGPSQEKCNLAVMREAGLTGPEVDCTECHGTGTSLGDPIEIGAYQKVLSVIPRSEPVAISTGKSNIGHCEGSAGVGGFIKCVEMCMHCETTPNCHLSALNPHLDMTGFPGRLMSEGLAYRYPTSYNGVLSFGFGGTNACAQVWGENTCSSRTDPTKKRIKILVDKIKQAPAQEVAITSEDWEQWEMDGPGKGTKPGDVWDVDITEDGAVTYFAKEKEIPDLGSFYYVTGAFNGWSYTPMEADDMLDGLYAATITLSLTGYDKFQIVADETKEMTFAPEFDGAARSGKVIGPTESSFCWSITGFPGAKYRVEFCKSEADKISVNWYEV
mmetsp:Transcript_58665/g.110400  ORF Transcript_58665/g.110400 Transcript_58665/m.110400 type:complete len:942 (+) Transcript_58665:64-2889(+)